MASSRSAASDASPEPPSLAADRRQDGAQRGRDPAGEARQRPVTLGGGARHRRRGRLGDRLLAGRPHRRELARVGLPLLSRLVELLLELGDVVARLDALGGQRHDLHAALELVTTAVADGHAREPRPLGLGARGALRAEHHAEDDLVALALDGHGAAGPAPVPEHDVEHPAQLGLVAEDLGSAARLDRDARLGGDLPEE